MSALDDAAVEKVKKLFKKPKSKPSKPKKTKASKKVFELAREVGLDSIALMDRLKSWKIMPKSHMSVLDSDTIDKIHELLDRRKK